MTVARDTDDYKEIILTVEVSAKLEVVIESALQFAIIEGAVVRFTFNEVEVIIDPIKIRDHIVGQYKTLRKGA